MTSDSSASAEGKDWLASVMKTEHREMESPRGPDTRPRIIAKSLAADITPSPRPHCRRRDREKMGGQRNNFP